MDASIFKSYDIRGIYPSQINEEAVFAAAQAFIQHTKAKNVVIGHDARLSSPNLFTALQNGLFAAGAQVTSIGQTPTEGVYFAVGNYDFDAGVMVTASHNPKEYNGLKMLVRPSPGEGGIEVVRGTDVAKHALNNSHNHRNDKKGAVNHLDIWPEYVAYMQKFSGNIKPFKVVIDASNGVMGRVIETIQNTLPIKIIPLNFKPDGNFPNHGPNPLDENTHHQIAEKIRSEKADFGFMFDGDGDRIFLMDERGTQVSADISLLLLAKYFLGMYQKRAIAYNLICSKSVPQFIAQWGGIPIRTPVGFVNVREGLIKNSGIMGGELSAHYCFKDYFYMDSGMIAFLTLLQIISTEGRPVSEIVKELTTYAPPAQVNFPIKDKELVLEKIKQTYADGTQDFLDGVTVEYKDWWFNARPSNTEPLLKLTIEAKTIKLLEEKKKELTAHINSWNH